MSPTPHIPYTALSAGEAQVEFEIKFPDLPKEMQIQLGIDYMREIFPTGNEEFVRQLVELTDFKGVRELFIIIKQYDTLSNSAKLLKGTSWDKDIKDIELHIINDLIPKKIEEIKVVKKKGWW